MPLNGGYSYREHVGPPGNDVTITAYLATRHQHSSRDVWLARLARGELELEGVRLDADVVLRRGQLLVWHRPPWHEPDVPRQYELLHEDAAVLAVIKPRGLPTMPAGGFLQNTLLAVVRERFPEVRPLHRLGRHTSGIVLFARTRDAAALLGRAWRAHAVEKRYRALGDGVAVWDTREIDVPIGPVAHVVLGTVHAASPQGKRAHSTASVVERREGTTLFDVDITTGRPHQVRIHLACAGHPLVGDPLYGAGGQLRADGMALPGDPGYQLHALRLRFVHPQTNARVEFVAPPPSDLRPAVEQS